ncbi:MAG: enoyl-CoA hydratase/isomerase family protein [Bacteroidia bacterium]
MEENQNQGYVRVKAKPDGITTITFFHPAQNSLPGKILNDLAVAIEDAGKNEAVKVIILSSGGDRTFCAGASFDELIQIGDFETGKKFFMGFAKVINACRTCGKIIIGRVQGKAVGGGVGLAAATDYCLATKFAQIRLSELAVGIGPFVVGPAVERKIGVSAMSQLALNATEWQTAGWAMQRGLFAEVYDSAEVMDNAITTLAEKLAASNPDALRMLKKAFWEGTEHWGELLEQRAEMSGKLILSEYSKHAIGRFKGEQ